MVDHNINHYLYRKRGVYYFSRRIPLDLQDQYSQTRIAASLKTKSLPTARRGAQSLAHQLDDYWMSLRVQRLSSAFVSRSVISPKLHTGTCGYSLSDARDAYLRLKGKGKVSTFHSAATRNCQYAIDSIGDHDLSVYKSDDGAKFRDHLVNKGLTGSSIKRIFSTLKSIVNLTSSEFGLDLRNPFTGVYLPDLSDSKSRSPIDLPTIKSIQSKCIEMNDDIRWLLALISDTGMRLSEAAGLKVDDIVLNSPTPHVVIQPNATRRLKTPSSQRLMPLAGVSLWAAQQIINNATGPYAFHRYTKTGICNANSASAAINKWMQEIAPNTVIHGFRHSMRDRLRALECPSDIVDAIGGWSKKSVGESYGDGYPLYVLSKWIESMTKSSN